MSSNDFFQFGLGLGEGIGFIAAALYVGTAIAVNGFDYLMKKRSKNDAV